MTQARGARRELGAGGVTQLTLLPRLTAIAPTAAEAVRHAGGWLFDQAMAGWDVTVITADHPDPRPLLVLGARIRDVGILTARPRSGTCLTAVAVCGELYESDSKVRELVLLAALRGGADIRVWGERCPHDFSAWACLVPHRMSLAAQAFKAQAMHALQAPYWGEGIEVFHRGDIRPEVLCDAFRMA